MTFERDEIGGDDVVSILTQFVLGEDDDDPADGLGPDEQQEQATDDLGTPSRPLKKMLISRLGTILDA
jgi:hypothetical protein